MGRTIKLDLPDEVYESLVASAEQQGQTPEELAVHYITESTQQTGADPLDKFIGVFNSKMPGWSDKHDEFIGAEAMKGSKDDANA
jgi:hypothetical protein